MNDSCSVCLALSRIRRKLKLSNKSWTKSSGNRALHKAEKRKKENKTMFFRGTDHAETFELELSYRPEGDNRYIAALYLLTADTKLWRYVQDQFGTRTVLVGEMRPRHLSGEAYVFYLLARELLCETKTINVMDLADRGLLSARCFQVVTTALFIRGYGLKKTREICRGSDF